MPCARSFRPAFGQVSRQRCARDSVFICHALWERNFMTPSWFAIKSISASLLILSVSAVVFAQSKGINAALLAKAKAGDADAELRVADSYSQLGNEKESCRWEQMAAQNGNAVAQGILADAYEMGFCGLPKDYAQAAVWWRKAAVQGDSMAQDSLAHLYYIGQGVPQDYSKAADWWRKAAEQGVDTSQYDLGQCYAIGQGVPKDDSEATGWFHMAAEQGLVVAEDRFANALLEGYGVTQSTKDAVAWFQKAAAQGDTSAAILLGQVFEYGGPPDIIRRPGGQSAAIPKDFARAASWYSVAANQGVPLAQDDLGHLYELGEGIPQDYAQAAQLYRQAAQRGDSDAQLRLGLLYAQGHGVPQDYAEAYFWFDLAAAGKLDKANAEAATTDRDQVASYLSPADLSGVQERARKWFEDHAAKPPAQ